MEIAKTNIRNKFRKSTKSYNEHAEVQKIIIDKLCNLMSNYIPNKFSEILEVGCGTGILTDKLSLNMNYDNYTVNDLVEDLCEETALRNGLNSLSGDVEKIKFDKKYDLIVSSSVFQWFYDLETMFNKFSSILNEEAYLVFSTFGPENFKEIKSITGEGLNYYEFNAIRTMLKSHFEIIYSGKEIEKLNFNYPSDVLKHLKNTGVNASSSNKVWTRSDLRRFNEGYLHFKSEMDSYPLTYEPYYFICKIIRK